MVKLCHKCARFAHAANSLDFVVAYSVCCSVERRGKIYCSYRQSFMSNSAEQFLHGEESVLDCIAAGNLSCVCCCFYLSLVRLYNHVAIQRI